MRKTIAAAAVLVGLLSQQVVAQVVETPSPGIRASADRLAAEAVLQGDVRGGPSVAKRATSVALIAAGIGAVLAGNPEYVPSQFAPGNMPNPVDLEDYLGPGSYPGHSYQRIRTRGENYGFLRWFCVTEADWCRMYNWHNRANYRAGYTDGFDDGRYDGLVEGHETGWNAGYTASQRDTIRILDAEGLVVYDGEWKPASYTQETFSDRKELRYAGVGLIAVGAVLNLVWPDSPARLDVAPLRGGGAVGATFGF